jgi:hypothetical protein
MRFVHSHSDLGLFLKSDLLDSERDLWVLHGDGLRLRHMDKVFECVPAVAIRLGQHEAILMHDE